MILVKILTLKWVPGYVIVGAGPSGLAAAACLKEKGVPSLVLERSNCIASLWQLKTYDRFKLHLPKQFCELPLVNFPEYYPTYPAKQQFIQYLEPMRDRFQSNSIYEEIIALCRIAVVFRLEDRELTIETLDYPDRYFVKWFMHVCCQEQQDQVGKD